MALEGGTDQVAAGVPGQQLRLSIKIRDLSRRVDSHQCVDIRFDQGPRVELLVAQLLLERLLAGDVAGSDKDAPELPRPVAEDPGVEGDRYGLPLAVDQRHFVIE